MLVLAVETRELVLERALRLILRARLGWQALPARPRVGP